MSSIKQFILSLIPTPKVLAQHPALRFISHIIHNQIYWKFHWRTVALGAAIGLFWAMIPVPFQMIPTTCCCVWFRGNIPVAIIGVWVSNPLTWLPIFYLWYLFGGLILGQQLSMVDFVDIHSISDLFQASNHVIIPLFVGGFAGGILCGIAGYLIVMLLSLFITKIH